MEGKRILMIQLFSNGDCLYATTVAKQIKNDFPFCHLTWAISSSCKNIIFNNPYVDEIWEIPIQRSSENETIFNNTIAEAQIKKQNGDFDEIFIPQVLGDNFSKYDSCVRTSIYRCYGRPVTVDKIPILEITNEEMQQANLFAVMNNLSSFKNVILFECAPQSGQVNIGKDFIREFCRNIIRHSSTCVILSSAKQIDTALPNVFDGSVLTIRQTAALSHYCSLLIGCSSGITWATYSSGGKDLPTLQLLNKDSYIYNPPSIAFERAGELSHSLIELFDFDITKASACISVILQQDFTTAKQLYAQAAKKQFKIYRGITHYFLKKRKFSLLRNFIKLNIAEHGWNPKMIASIGKGLLFFPLQLTINKWTKN